ncbi:MAG: hypothetical protein ACMUHX_00825 [bacterium]
MAMVRVTTETDSSGNMLRLIETSINTGIYQAEVDVGYKDNNPFVKRIKAGLGDTIFIIWYFKKERLLCILKR